MWSAHTEAAVPQSLHRCVGSMATDVGFRRITCGLVWSGTNGALHGTEWSFPYLNVIF